MQLSAQISEKWIKKNVCRFLKEKCIVFLSFLQSVSFFPFSILVFCFFFFFFKFWFQRKVKHILDLCVNVFVILLFWFNFNFFFVSIGFWYCLKWLVNYFKIAGHGLQFPPPAIQDRFPYLWKHTYISCLFFSQDIMRFGRF